MPDAPVPDSRPCACGGTIVVARGAYGAPPALGGIELAVREHYRTPRHDTWSSVRRWADLLPERREDIPTGAEMASRGRRLPFVLR
jgi:hypothetical protein